MAKKSNSKKAAAKSATAKKAAAKKAPVKKTHAKKAPAKKAPAKKAVTKSLGKAIPNLAGEQWKKMNKSDRPYLISNYGRVKSFFTILCTEPLLTAKM